MELNELFWALRSSANRYCGYTEMLTGSETLTKYKEINVVNDKGAVIRTYQNMSPVELEVNRINELVSIALDFNSSLGEYNKDILYFLQGIFFAVPEGLQTKIINGEASDMVPDVSNMQMLHARLCGSEFSYNNHKE